MAAADIQASFNALPHIDTLVENGVRSVQDNLPELPDTLWMLKHKHFDLHENEVLLYDVREDTIEVSVVPKGDGQNMHPCQAFYDNGEWKVIGYATTECHLTLPEQEGSGMVTSVLKEGRMMELTSSKSRIQRLVKWDGVLTKDNTDVVITALKDKAQRHCMVCATKKAEHVHAL